MVNLHKENEENKIFDILPKSLINYEMKKYKSKGFGFFFAFLIAMIYFFGLPIILEKIWPNKIENPGYFFVVVIYCLNNGLLILYNLEFFIIYKLGHQYFERYKTTPEPWPWQSDKQKWNSQIKRTLLRVFFNNFILLPLFFLPDLISNDCQFRYDTNSFPSYLETFWQMCLCLIIEDFIFYLSHRLLHNKYFYSKFHKIHHEFVETIAIAATYSHPVEYILGNILPSAVGPLILGKKMHIFTYLIYIIMVLHETHSGHSGYNFPWSPHRIMPFTFDSEFHIFHHWKYTGNFANYLSIWDRVFGTVNKSYMEYFKNKEKYLAKYKISFDGNYENTKENSNPNQFILDNKKFN
jgi:sterol desaturase/sphingolipid hydroxylase (fatty acid hydroxylase superfamily)